MPREEQKSLREGFDKQPTADKQEMLDDLCRALVKALKAELPAQPVAAHPENTGGARNGEQTLDLIALFYRLLANVKYVILAAVVCAVAGGIYGYKIVVPLYSATAKLYVIHSNDSAINLSDLQIGASLTLDYQEVFRTWEVHEMVRAELGLDYSYSKLQDMLKVENPSNTRVLYITVSSENPQEAAAIANAYAAAAKRFIIESMETSKPNVFSIALVPGAAVGRGPTTYILVGFLLGTLLSAGIIILRFMLDDRPQTPDDIAKYAGISTLAIIPADEKRSGESHTTKRGGQKWKEQA